MLLFAHFRACLCLLCSFFAVFILQGRHYRHQPSHGTRTEGTLVLWPALVGAVRSAGTRPPRFERERRHSDNLL